MRTAGDADRSQEKRPGGDGGGSGGQGECRWNGVYPGEAADVTLLWQSMLSPNWTIIMASPIHQHVQDMAQPIAKPKNARAKGPYSPPLFSSFPFRPIKELGDQARGPDGNVLKNSSRDNTLAYRARKAAINAAWTCGAGTSMPSKTRFRLAQASWIT